MSASGHRPSRARFQPPSGGGAGLGVPATKKRKMVQKMEVVGEQWISLGQSVSRGSAKGIADQLLGFF